MSDLCCAKAGSRDSFAPSPVLSTVCPTDASTATGAELLSHGESDCETQSEPDCEPRSDRSELSGSLSGGCSGDGSCERADAWCLGFPALAPDRDIGGGSAQVRAEEQRQRRLKRRPRRSLAASLAARRSSLAFSALAAKAACRPSRSKDDGRVILEQYSVLGADAGSWTSRAGSARVCSAATNTNRCQPSGQCQEDNIQVGGDVGSQMTEAARWHAVGHRLAHALSLVEEDSDCEEWLSPSCGQPFSQALDV
mmetsp:Transcript_26551/g.58288  ORF Transcript_26551/g.58288 Transcript_26551/m.58288 type:complete len:253 (-) Transcript_26551:140-898(-)